MTAVGAAAGVAAVVGVGVIVGVGVVVGAAESANKRAPSTDHKANAL